MRVTGEGGRRGRRKEEEEFGKEDNSLFVQFFPSRDYAVTVGARVVYVPPTFLSYMTLIAFLLFSFFLPRFLSFPLALSLSLESARE